MTHFRISGLAPAQFTHLYGLGDGALGALGVVPYVVDAKPGFPDRIEMRDLEVGERALLLNYTHLDARSPYRSSHAIFVREAATEPYDRVNEVPEVMRTRALSLRAFDADHMMVDSDLTDGGAIEALIERFFSDPRVAYIHVHNAKPGCYSGRITRE
ncbi:MAG: DUF1203 domain-containing protein [Candidatus Eremiobacteraeota bacterium]|nr:DUF1203 domain-containing protein [Candidatus Eremiobacteraeota bacterium]MBV8498590.1 DUF1203 domain-containing protein [Candidatus Eremiobacteraeota bacterium]